MKLPFAVVYGSLFALTGAASADDEKRVPFFDWTLVSVSDEFDGTSYFTASTLSVDGDSELRFSCKPLPKNDRPGFWEDVFSGFGIGNGSSVMLEINSPNLSRYFIASDSIVRYRVDGSEPNELFLVGRSPNEFKMQVPPYRGSFAPDFANGRNLLVQFASEGIASKDTLEFSLVGAAGALSLLYQGCDSEASKINPGYLLKINANRMHRGSIVDADSWFPKRQEFVLTGFVESWRTTKTETTNIRAIFYRGDEEIEDVYIPWKSTIAPNSKQEFRFTVEGPKRATGVKLRFDHPEY